MAKKKVKKNIPFGVAHVHATFNNTVITLTDQDGNVVAWSSSGAVGYKGSKKSTPFAAQLAADAAAKAAMEHGMTSVTAEIKGRGPGKDAAVKQLAVAGLEVKSIKDVTPTAHNGCRLKKSRLNK